MKKATYHSSRECPSGHTERYVSNNRCVICTRNSIKATTARRSAANKLLGKRKGAKPKNFPDRPKPCSCCGVVMEPSAYTLTRNGYLAAQSNKCRYRARKFRGIDMDRPLGKPMDSVLR